MMIYYYHRVMLTAMTGTMVTRMTTKLMMRLKPAMMVPLLMTVIHDSRQ
jgi:hypothetical protein